MCILECGQLKVYCMQCYQFGLFMCMCIFVTCCVLMDLYVGGIDIYIYIGGFYDNDPITKIDVSIYYLWCMYMYIISVIRYSLFPGCLCGVVLDCVLLISVAYGESCPTWLHPSGDGECLCGALW